MFTPDFQIPTIAFVVWFVLGCIGALMWWLIGWSNGAEHKSKW